MAVVTCPECGGSDLDRDRDVRPAHGVGVRCIDCGHHWVRTPRRVCPRCGSGDVESGVVDGWAFDDLDAARDDPALASWSYVDRAVHRCRHCYQEWWTVEGTRPYHPTPARP